MLEVGAALAKVALYGAALCAAGISFAGASLAASTAGLEKGQTRLQRLGGISVVVASVTTLSILAARLGGLDTEILVAISATTPARAAMLQVAGGLLLALAPSASRPKGSVASLIGGGLVVSSFAVSGHAAAQAPAAMALAAVHVAAAAWWTGALLLLHAARGRQGPLEFAALVGRFSRQAVLSIGLLLAAGGTLVVILTDARPLPLDDYRRLLIVKLTLAATLLLAAVRNRTLLAPRLGAGGSADRKLADAIVVELVLIVAILTTTAALTVLTSPHEGT